jgi:hypothetical protein
VVNEDRGTADFTAALNMEQSDQGITNIGNANPKTDPDPFDMPALRAAHTHHIVTESMTVTKLPNGGIQVVGPIKLITKDGSPAPFAQSSLHAQVTGGTSIEYSNVTLTFIGPATMHFGSQAVHGVIRNVDKYDEELAR